MAAWISKPPFDAWSIISQYQTRHLQKGRYGACGSFIGSLRDFSSHGSIDKMVLEHYPEMTERYLHKLENEAREQWPLQDCLIVHRVGEIFPADNIVLIACWSAHRRAALDACNWLIEQIKQRAPFWKKEFNPEGAQWVKTNTDGHSFKELL